MAQDTFLITKKYLVENVPVDQNIAENDIKSAFRDTHLFDLVFLGIPLLDLFHDHVKNGTAMTPVLTDLFGMTQYFIAYRVYYALSFNMFKISNAGVTQPQNTMTLADVKELRGQIDARSATLKRRILEFMKVNQGAIPQAAPEPVVTLDNDPLDTLGIVWSPNVPRYIY